MKEKLIEVIIPCYNEEACIKLVYRSIHDMAKKLNGYKVSIIFIDDGSTDKTLMEIKKLEKNCDKDEVHHIAFARNFGKEAAIYAGLVNTNGDYVALLDADLQHPPELLIQMVKEIENGYECCGAQRITRDADSKVRNALSGVFYKLISKLTSIKMEQGTTDYRLMSRKFVDAVISLSEKNRFTKGIFSWVGFETKWIKYKNIERAAGETKWSFQSLLRYAINGFIAFAATPLRGAIYIGFLVMMLALVYAAIVIISAATTSGVRNGYSSIMAVVLLLGGIIIFLLGMIGEYLARIYIEVKGRPIYIAKEINISNYNKIQESNDIVS